MKIKELKAISSYFLSTLPIFRYSNLHFTRKNIKRNCRDYDVCPTVPFGNAMSLGYYCTTLGGMTSYSCTKGSSKYIFAVLPLV